MHYEIRKALPREGVRIASLLKESLSRGVHGKFKIDNTRLFNHVAHLIQSVDSFAYVLVADGEIVGCFMGELVQHTYIAGYIANELGVYIKPGHRGGSRFKQLLHEFLKWVSAKPDVLFTKFTIGQLGATTPYLRNVMKVEGFTQGDEGYYKI